MNDRAIYRIMPGEAGHFSVFDELGNIISEGEDLRNVYEATKFAQDWARERGLSVDVITPHEASPRPMLFSSSSLRVVEDIKDQFGRGVKRAALELARSQGRNLVTDEDIWSVVDRLDWTILDEDS